MKLLSCYISNFGKFSDEKLDFVSGLTTFTQDNGSGKTTLASFIVAMFYGLPQNKSSSKFNDRKHYYPFNKGKFGGSITLEKEGHQYRIERYFGPKTDAEDTIAVYKDDSLFTDYGEGIGKYLFGIDEESFRKTVFITNKDFESSDRTSSGIVHKLNNFIDDSSSSRGFDDICESLKQYKKIYTSRSKDLGKIQIKTEEIRDLKAKIQNASGIETILADKQQKYSELQKELEELDAKINAARTRDVELEKWKTLDSLKEKQIGLKQKLANLENKYPKGLPTQSEIDECNILLNEISNLEAALSSLKFDDGKEARLSALSVHFVNGVPTDDELNALRKDVDDYRSKSVLLDSLTNAEVGDREKELKARFFEKGLSDEKIKDEESEVSSFIEKEKIYNETPANIQGVQNVASTLAKKKTSPLYLVFLVIGVLVAVTGVVLFFANVNYAAIACLALGIIGIFINGFVYLSKKASNASLPAYTPVDVPNPEKAKAYEAMSDAKNEVLSFILPFGYSPSVGVPVAFNNLKNDWEEYKRLEQDNTKKTNEIDSLSEDTEARKQSLKDRLTKYGYVGDDYSGLLTSLISDSKSYSELKEEKTACNSKVESNKSSKQDKLNKLLSIITKYGFAYNEFLSDNLKNIKQDLYDLDSINKSLIEGEEGIKKYQLDNNLFKRTIDDGEPLDVLTNKRNNVFADLQRLSDELKDDEETVGLLAERRDSLLIKEEELKQLNNRLKIIEKTTKFLEEAEAALVRKYIGPIQSEFNKFAEIIEKAFPSKIVMDKEFNLSFTEDGEYHDEKFLSDGQRTVLMLCFRLALIQNMYEGDPPFIILDDPFTALDGRHMELAKRVISALSMHYQLIYFTCHESRSIGEEHKDSPYGWKHIPGPKETEDVVLTTQENKI